MYSTTDAIVLALQPHSDKAHILHAYTRAYGRVNYMVYGLGRKHAIGLYQPLTLLRITGGTPNAEAGRPSTLKEATRLTPVQTENELVCNAICLFISEVLFHTLRYPMADERLFEYIEKTARELSPDPNYHIAFLVGLAAELGFAIDEQTHPELMFKPVSRTERQQLLRRLCKYFDEHVESWQTPRSLDVLMEVFD